MFQLAHMNSVEQTMGLSNHKFTTFFVILEIGSTFEIEKYKDGRKYNETSMETVVYHGNSRVPIKSLTMPNVIHSDEPNFVAVEIFKGVLSHYSDYLFKKTKVFDVFSRRSYCAHNQ